MTNTWQTQAEAFTKTLFTETICVSKHVQKDKKKNMDRLHTKTT